MICQHCGTELTPDAAFCARCGQAAAPTATAATPADANLRTQAMSPVAAAALAPGAAAAGSQPAHTVAMPQAPQPPTTAGPGPQITEPAAPPPQNLPGPAAGYEATALAVPPGQGQPQKPARGKAAMTLMAGAGLSMAETFNTAFGQRFPGWRTELAAPAGPSTGGGKQAIQPISIIGSTGNRLAIGRVDPVQRTVTLRTFNFVTAMHLQRFGGHLAISPTDYQSFLGSVGTMFSATGFRIDYEDAAPTAVPTAATASGSGTIVWILLALLVLTGLGLLLYWQLWAK